VAYRNFKPVYEDDCVRMTDEGECLTDKSFDSID
jgi:hypothetical protein